MNILLRFSIMSIFVLYHLVGKGQEYCSSDNRELREQLIAYYMEKNETEKIKAAEFLLDNMPYHYSIKSEIIDSYYNGIVEANHKYRYPEIKKHVEELYEEYSQKDLGRNLLHDADVLTLDFLVRCIDHSYDKWKNGLWANHLSFNDYCEYLLPYRVGTENIEEWRDSLEKEYLHRIDWLFFQDDRKNSTYWAASFLNDQIKNKGFNIFEVAHLSGIDLPYRVLKNMRMGECEDYAAYATMVMRACGLPVALDFTPQWPFRSSGHSWNTLLDKTGKNIPFMGGESNPGYPCKPGSKMAKVYRKTFAYQHQSLYDLNLEIREIVPDFLDTPFIKDVSDDYFQGVDIHVALCGENLRKKHFLYLSVFNNQQWIPVDYSLIDSLGIGTFHNMGRGIIYLPTYWGHAGSYGASDPIEVLDNGDVNILIPDTINLQSITMHRKYPAFSSAIYYSKRVVGGYFEGSNTADFKNPVLLAEIRKNPNMNYDTISVYNRQAYRFYRYVSPKNGHCNIAEIQFESNDTIVSPISFMSDGHEGKGYTPKYAFDKDELTFYQSNIADGAWIGCDMGKTVAIDKVIYLPRNDDNHVVPNHLYRLDYYQGGALKRGEPMLSTSYSITFDKVPTNALYILHDLSKGTEERIFTYTNNQIKWY